MPPLIKKPASPTIPLPSESKEEEKNYERVAINLFDLDRLDPIIRSTLLTGKMDLSEPIRVDKNKVDEVGVLFSCDLVSAGCICDTAGRRFPM
jgi:hypothetical protein